MILNGTAGAVIAAFYLFVYGLIGMAAGGLVHLFARRRWGWKAAVADWALAVAAGFVFVIVLTLVVPPQVWFNWSTALEGVAAAAAVVGRRPVPLVLRRRGTVGGNRPS